MKSSGKIVAVKGGNLKEEIDETNAKYDSIQLETVPLNSELIDTERKLVIIQA